MRGYCRWLALRKGDYISIHLSLRNLGKKLLRFLTFAFGLGFGEAPLVVALLARVGESVSILGLFL